MKKIFFVGASVGAIIWSGAGLAQDRLVSQGTDANAANAFGDNPAAFSPKEANVGVEVQQRTNSHSLEVFGNNPSRSDFDVYQNRTNIAYMSPSGPGFTLGFTGMIDNRSVEASSNRGSDRRIVETFQTTEGGLRMIVGLSDKARVGLTMRYQAVRSNIVGSFSANESDRTIYTGTLLGYGLGLSVGDKTGSFGVAYLPPLKGKAKVSSESKIMADPGLTMAQVAFEVTPALRVGGVIRKWTHKRDDRVQPTTSPINQTAIFLAGTDVERDLLVDQEVQLGVDFLMGGGAAIRLSGATKQYEFVFDPEAVPGASGNVDNRFTSYVYGGALQYAGPKSDFQAGLQINPRKKDFRQGGADRAYKAQDQTMFVAISMGL